MPNFHLHIVSLNVPYPPDYGGVIDIFYKIKALYHLGVQIHLHCYDYGRGPQAALEEYCAEVHYYRRQTGWGSHLSSLPYIIRSRRSTTLLQRLKKDQFPILLEGLHTTYWLLQNALPGRPIILRSHNIEHDYYAGLAQQEPRWWRRWYFQKEAALLRRALKKVPTTTTVAAISPADVSELQRRFANTFWLPPFHPNARVNPLPGCGEYALYHGNLSVPENILAAQFLIRQFRGKTISLILAGKDPSETLSAAIAGAANIDLIANPTAERMEALIRQAQVVLLPTFQATGIKLKLLESLCKGRHIVANPAMVQNTGLAGLCTVVSEDFWSATKCLWDRPFSQNDLEQRARQFFKDYDNGANAQKLIQAFGLEELS